ncbi:MAG: Sialic acid TRAP transporter permease protein SiaT [Syntrophorhabdus sp. PtaU1.Bin058]|nr:MAG: Sialic acid TRAP transporter permease protein SiaT [Syntrophorhabdus sp. PtaU1.Bin058]
MGDKPHDPVTGSVDERIAGTSGDRKIFNSSGNTVIYGIAVLSGILIIVNGIIGTFDVFMRYFFNSPTIWVAEISIYLVIASSFLPLAYVQLKNGHVKVDTIVNWLSPRTALSLEIVTTILAIVYCLVIDWQGAKMVYTSYLTSETSPTLLRVPVVIPQLFIPLGALCLTVQLFRFLCKLIKTMVSGKGEGPGPDQQGATTGNAHKSLISGPILIPGIFLVLLFVAFVFLKVKVYIGLLLLFGLLLFSGIPVAFGLGLFGVFCLYFLFGGTAMLVQVPVMAYSALDSSITVALPLFVLTSIVLREGGIGARLYRFADVLVRHLPGGLGIASVLFCCLFAAMTGSSVAVAATVSMIALPEMLARGYDRKFCIGLMAAGGTLGILFPPSLPLMLYGSMTGESLGALFMATLIPGIILAGMFCIYVAVVAGGDKNVQRLPRASAKEIAVATKNAAGGLFTIVIIVGGIYSGIFTPTESGSIALVYSIILCCFIHRTVKLDGLLRSTLEAIGVNAMIMFIIIGANIAGQVILMSQIPANLLTLIKESAVPVWAVIGMINIFLILMGGPLEAITILVITLPVLYPLITGLGLSGLWFAVIMMINMELALISPPEGLNLFILQNIGKATANEVSRGVLPYLAVIAVFLVLISVFPAITMWLPSMMMAK